MASQQVLFSETIAGMKKAFKRKAYESDSDSDIDSYSNRGQKLKKRARFAHKGQLVPTNGPSSYRQFVEYAGLRRPILYRNPPLLDDEGYEIESDDDEVRLQEAEALASELNPYANIQLEHLLAPLTASTGLSTHQTLSKPFTSKTLTKLVDQSCDNMRKENHSLWQVRHLLTALCGDFTWIPCEAMVKPSDIELFTDDHVARHLLSLSKPHVGGSQMDLPSMGINGSAHGLNGIETGGIQSHAVVEGQLPHKIVTEDIDVSMADTNAAGQAGSRPDQDRHKTIPNGEANGTDSTPTMKQEEGDARAEPRAIEKNKSSEHVDDAVNPKSGGDKAPETPSLARTAEGEAADAHNSNDLSNGVQGVSIPLEGLEQLFVHPMFIAPVGTKPDRDVGLPEQEAEDIRRLLALYVQKQEEVCRGAKKLFLGLLRADKLRKDVLHWSKAEAHSGPNRDMSDGEDWYDKEEWGLTEDLKKGQDEEEEDTQTTGKKTRNRRT
ncbi:RXT2-like protein [Dactylonectria estremocensis]|uniref:RXT2-like protein n=1 Tax=Dactylonectria estremocensis TaxID=1079267 RepID=A0A9P9FD42_9HYPO|nr:RXT2-like protein [Dactylonectria estremocensis]